MTVELKPCPFCGSTAIKDDVYQRDGRMVVCRECHASVGEFNPEANAKAITKWNRRSRAVEQGEWIKWDGGDFQPVPGEMLVMVMLRDGSIEGPARTREFAGTDSCWKHRGSDGDIIAYRLYALTNTSGDDEAPVAWRYRHKEWSEDFWNYFTKEPRYREDDEIWEGLYARPQSAAVRDGWEPIETAPKDGTPILARYEWQGEDRFMVIRRHKENPWWMADHDSYIKHDDSKVTHRNFGFTNWRPLPTLGGDDAK